MTVSVDLNDLAQYLASGTTRRESVNQAAQGVIATHQAVSPQCTDFGPSGSNLDKAIALANEMHHLNTYVNIVRQGAIEADRLGLSAAETAALIDSNLERAGLDATPTPMAFDDITLVGIPPTSGFVDDPVCAVNGNFVHGDEDLTFPGLASRLNHVRVYNSLCARRKGRFGAGWTSVLDAHLERISDEEYIFHLPDGGGRLLERGTGGRLRTKRGDAVLWRDESGAIVTMADEVRWRFSAGGQLVEYGDPVASVRVTYANNSVRLEEERSGRWLEHTFDGGLVVASSSSDGRQVHYEYEDGLLVSAIRPGGTLTYRYEDQRIVSIIDLDGVASVRNEYDELGRVVQQESAHGRVTKYIYGEERVTRVTGDDGITNTFIHDETGNLTVMVDGARHAARMTYDDAGNLATYTDRTNRTTEFTRDFMGRVLVRTDPDGGEHRWTYDDLGRVASETTRSGQSFELEYDEDNRSPRRIVATGVGASSLALNAQGLPERVEDADGVQNRFEWTADGQVGKITTAVGSEVLFRYDAAGRLLSARRSDGSFAEFDLDDGGRVTSATSDLGRETYRYSPAGRPIGGTTVDGVAWTADLDDAGEVTRVLTDGELDVEFERDSSGRIEVTRTADGAEFRHTFDEVGRLVGVIDPLGSATRREFDPEGRLLALVDANGSRWHRTLDQLGRTLAVVDPVGSTATYEYDPSGQVSRLASPLGTSWSFSYDPLGRPSEVEEPTGAITSFVHSPAGRLTGLTDATRQSTTFEYENGLPRRTVRPNGRTTVYERDENGQVSAEQTDSRRRTIERDTAGRIVEIAGDCLRLTAEYEGRRVSTFALGGGRSTFTSGPAGRLESVTDAAGVDSVLAYDRRGQVARRTTSDKVESRAYDACGRLISERTHGLFSTNFQRDAAGRVVKVGRAENAETRLEYDSAGRVLAATAEDGTQVRLRRREDGTISAAATADSALDFEIDAAGRLVRTRANGYAIDYSRDAAGRVTTIRSPLTDDIAIHRDEDGEILGFAPSSGQEIKPARPAVPDRDDFGRLRSDGRDRTFSYDDSGRLRSVHHDNRNAQEFEYDSLGRLVAEQANGVDRRTFEFNFRGQVSQELRGTKYSKRFDYDELGRRVAESTSDGFGTTYRWDGLDRLVEVEYRRPNDAPETIAIQYDGLGRVCSVDGDRIIWDDGLSGRPLAVGGKRFVHHGAAFHEIGGNGGWSKGVPDDPWGQTVGRQTTLGYRGSPQHRSLVFFGARVYDVDTRRFLSPDPAPWAPGERLATDPYAYAFNDPVNFLDPTGLKPLSDAEYSAIVEAQSKGAFEKAWDTMKEDPWGTLAMAGVVAVGAALVVFAAPVAAAVGVATATVAAVGTGIVVASSVAAGLGLATGTFDPRRVALSGLFGAVIPVVGASVAATAVVGAVAGGAYNVADQIIAQDRPFSEIDWSAVAVDAVVGAATFGLAKVASGRIVADGSRTADDVLRVGTKDSWGNLDTLDDHFARHGADFAASSADDYARQASAFLQQPGTLTKIDPKTGVIRIYDPATNTFGAYNPTGTTRTFYRLDPEVHGYPTNIDYWNAQPG